MNTNYKFFNGIYDRVFKAVFCDKSNKHLMIEFLNRILDINIDTLEYLNNELPINNVYDKSKTVDILVNANNKYIHIELNINGSIDYLNIRNFTFFTTFISNKVKRGDKYDLTSEFIHIDISKNLKYDELYREYYVMDRKNNKYIKNVKIIEYNLDNIEKNFYNLDKEVVKKYRTLYMLIAKKEELSKLSKGDEFIMEYIDKVNDLNRNEKFRSFLTKEEDERFILNTEKDISYREGIEKGTKERNIEIAKTLKNKNYSIEEIKDITNLSYEEIKNI